MRLHYDTTTRLFNYFTTKSGRRPFRTAPISIRLRHRNVIATSLIIIIINGVTCTIVNKLHSNHVQQLKFSAAARGQQQHYQPEYQRVAQSRTSESPLVPFDVRTTSSGHVLSRASERLVVLFERAIDSACGDICWRI